jgi:hypothetical protein
MYVVFRFQNLIVSLKLFYVNNITYLPKMFGLLVSIFRAKRLHKIVIGKNVVTLSICE